MDTSSKGPIKSQFEADDQARHEILERARLCAALSKPWVLPPAQQNPNAKLPENYQGVGSRGVANLEGKMLLALWPPGQPWFSLEPAAQIQFDDAIEPEQVQALKQALFLESRKAHNMLESTSMDMRSGRAGTGFRAHKREVLSQLLITGDVLERLRDDYRMVMYRRDMYVTKRDSSKQVLYHIIKEELDPLSLTDEQQAMAQFDTGFQDKPVSQRLTDMFTLVEWQPREKEWVIKQEINGHIVNESTEKVTPFFSTPYELAAGEDYGRGLVELNLGDLRSLNELEIRRLDLLGNASKILYVLDETSSVRDSDLAKPTGSVIRGKVKDGQVMDIAVLSSGKFGEYQMLVQGIESKTKELGKAFLMESETTPTGERVTATQVQRVALELEGALGGVYAPIADHQQTPLLRRLMFQLMHDKIVATVKPGAANMQALTGLAALGREGNRERLLALTGVIAQLGDTAIRKIDMGVLIDVLARFESFYEAGLIKTDAQLQKEDQAAREAALQQQAGEQAIKTTGSVVENNLQPQPTNTEAA